MTDPVNHPAHYNAHPSGIEAITVCEHLTFNIGNAVKATVERLRMQIREEEARRAYRLRRSRRGLPLSRHAPVEGGAKP